MKDLKHGDDYKTDELLLAPFSPLLSAYVNFLILMIVFSTVSIPFSMDALQLVLRDLKVTSDNAGCPCSIGDRTADLTYLKHGHHHLGHISIYKLYLIK